MTGNKKIDVEVEDGVARRKRAAEQRKFVAELHAKNAAAVLELLKQMPIKATFESADQVAAEARELREWLESFISR